MSNSNENGKSKAIKVGLYANDTDNTSDLGTIQVTPEFDDDTTDAGTVIVTPDDNAESGNQFGGGVSDIPIWERNEMAERQELEDSGYDPDNLPGGNGGESQEQSQLDDRPEYRGIDRDFIAISEGGNKLEAYVPLQGDDPHPNSGVTVGIGVDLGGLDEDSMQKMGWPQELIDKLVPYTGHRGQDALDLITQQPLTITEEEASIMNDSLLQQNLDPVINNFNSLPNGITFSQLSDGAKTAIADLAMQYGPNLMERTPHFWTYFTTQNWPQAINELRNFKDDFDSRRGREADLIEQDLYNGKLPVR